MAMKFPCGLILFNFSGCGCKLFENTAVVVVGILETILSLCIKSHHGSSLPELVGSTNYFHMWCQSSLKKV